MTAWWACEFSRTTLVGLGGDDSRNRDILVPDPSKPGLRHSASGHTERTRYPAYSCGAPWHSGCCRSSARDVVKQYAGQLGEDPVPIV
jgi:hypothetical protein